MVIDYGILGAMDAMKRKPYNFNLQNRLDYMSGYNFEKKYHLLEEKITLDVKEKKERMERLMEDLKDPFR